MAASVQILLTFLFVVMAESHLLKYLIEKKSHEGHNNLLKAFLDVLPNRPLYRKKGTPVPFIPVPYTNALDLLHHLLKPYDVSKEQSISSKEIIFTYDKTPDEMMKLQNSLKNDNDETTLIAVDPNTATLKVDVNVDKRKKVTEQDSNFIHTGLQSEGQIILNLVNTDNNISSVNSVPYYILIDSNGQTHLVGVISEANIQNEGDKTNSVLMNVEDNEISNEPVLVSINNVPNNNSPNDDTTKNQYNLPLDVEQDSTDANESSIKNDTNEKQQ